MDGHVWYLRHNHDEVGDARVKVALWYVPNTGGERHFFFTLETKLFHFPDADPDCWYITSIEPFDAIPWHRARREAEAAAEAATKAKAKADAHTNTQEHPQPHDPHPPDKPP
jgi:hypothetical protein